MESKVSDARVEGKVPEPPSPASSESEDEKSSAEETPIVEVPSAKSPSGEKDDEHGDKPTASRSPNASPRPRERADKKRDHTDKRYGRSHKRTEGEGRRRRSHHDKETSAKTRDRKAVSAAPSRRSRRPHGGSDKAKLLDEDPDASVQCPTCKKWVSRYGYTQHREGNRVCLEKQAAAKRRGERTPSPPKEVWHYCKYCPRKWFSSVYDLNQHMVTVHGCNAKSEGLSREGRSRSPSSIGPSASEAMAQRASAHHGGQASALQLTPASQIGATETSSKEAGSAKMARFLRGVADMLDG